VEKNPIHVKSYDAEGGLPLFKNRKENKNMLNEYGNTAALHGWGTRYGSCLPTLG
jgi:hypothetical protein